VSIRLARAGRGTLRNAFSSTPGAIQAFVSIRRDAETRSAQVTLDQQEVINVDLDGLRVRITVSYADGEFKSINKIVFEVVELQRIIQLIVEETGWGVQIDQDRERVVTEGQILRYPIEGRKVTIEFLENSFSVSDESPAQVPDDQRRVLALDATYD